MDFIGIFATAVILGAVFFIYIPQIKAHKNYSDDNSPWKYIGVGLLILMVIVGWLSNG